MIIGLGKNFTEKAGALFVSSAAKFKGAVGMKNFKGLTSEDLDFVRIINAASHLGDGRQRHIRAYKRLVIILEKLRPGISRWPKNYSR